jgi:hypothetical protein
LTSAVEGEYNISFCRCANFVDPIATVRMMAVKLQNSRVLIIQLFWTNELCMDLGTVNCLKPKVEEISRI